MKKMYLLLAVTVLFVWSCSKKTTPSSTTIPSTETVAAKPATGDIAEGKSTYEAKCGKCHGLINPEKFTAVKWVGLVNWMAPKAHLDDAEKQNVLAYVQANAKP